MLSILFLQFCKMLIDIQRRDARCMIVVIFYLRARDLVDYRCIVPSVRLSIDIPFLFYFLLFRGNSLVIYHLSDVNQRNKFCNKF